MAEPTVLLDIREQPLDVAEVMTAVADPTAGGTTLFSGTVRDHDGRDGVTHLEYSAHPQARAELERVVAEVVEEYDVIRVAALHRVGRVAVGETAVLVAVATAHRDQAFAASRALIDRLKAQVPIWKHQHFADGSEEWVGLP